MSNDREPSPALLILKPIEGVDDRDETILVVDDEASVRALIGATLRAEGWTILEAADGEDALRAVEEYAQPVAAVVADLMMPRLGGMKLFEKLRSWYPGIRFLLISGFDPPAEMLRRELPPRSRFVSKPFAPSELVSALEDLLA